MDLCFVVVIAKNGQTPQEIDLAVQHVFEESYSDEAEVTQDAAPLTDQLQALTEEYLASLNCSSLVNLNVEQDLDAVIIQANKFYLEMVCCSSGFRLTLSQISNPTIEFFWGFLLHFQKKGYLVYSWDREKILTFSRSDEAWFYDEVKDVSVLDLFMEPIRGLFGR
jgi:hypothetical protein